MRFDYARPTADRQLARVRSMAVQALGYIGFRTQKLEDWREFGTSFLGMQLIERARATLAFRMDDRRQRVLVTGGEEGGRFYGWEVADRTALDGIAGRLDHIGTPGSWLSAADC